MRISAGDYRQAAKQHVAAAFELHEAHRYVLSHYIAGVAVECLLRAYRLRVNTEFEARHDLYKLFKDSHFSENVPEGLIVEVGERLSIVATRWSNDHRYRSEAALLRYLKGARLDRGIRGDVLKESSRRIVDAASYIVTLGDIRWESARRA